MDENSDKRIIKTLSGKYSQKLFDHTKESATDALKILSKMQLKKAMDFCLLLKIWIKISVKKYVRTWVVFTFKSFLIIPKNLPQMHLKLSQKPIQKAAQATADLTGTKIPATKIPENCL